MCTTNQPVDPYNVLYNNVIYKGVTMKKPSLGDDKEYWDSYKTHLASLPNEPNVNNIPMGPYVFKTV